MLPLLRYLRYRDLPFVQHLDLATDLAITSGETDRVELVDIEMDKIMTASVSKIKVRLEGACGPFSGSCNDVLNHSKSALMSCLFLEHVVHYRKGRELCSRHMQRRVLSI